MLIIGRNRKQFWQEWPPADKSLKREDSYVGPADDPYEREGEDERTATMESTRDIPTPIQPDGDIVKKVKAHPALDKLSRWDAAKFVGITDPYKQLAFLDSLYNNVS